MAASQTFTQQLTGFLQDRRLWPPSLRLKLTIALSAMILAIMGTGALTMLTQQERLLQEAAEERARAIGRTLAAVGSAAVIENLFRLQESMQHYLKDDTILDIDIVDPDNLIIASMNERRIGLTLEDHAWLDARRQTAESVMASTTPDGQPVLVVVEPLIDRQVIAAWVRLTVSLVQVQRERDETATRIVLIASALIGAGILAISMTFRRVSNVFHAVIAQLKSPLDTLGRTLSAGGTVAQVPAHRSVAGIGHTDEIDRLADIAGQTVQVLTVQSEALQQFARTLEEKVAQRTVELEQARQQAVQSLEALRDNEQQLRSIVDTAPDGIIIVNGQGKVRSSNPAACRMFGYSADEMVGKDIETMLQPPSKKGAAGFFGFVLPAALFSHKSVSVNLDLIGLRKNGAKFPVDMSLSQVALRDHPHLTAIVRDITDRRRAEETKRRHELRLRQMTEEREQMYKDLHDGMLQSLYAVGMTLESTKVLLAQTPHEASQQLDRAVSQIRRLVQDLRDFIPRLWPEMEAPNELEAALHALVHSSAAWPSIPFKVKIDRATASRLSQEQELALLHIAREGIGNIVRHARARSGVIHLYTHKNTVRLALKDDGVGFKIIKSGSAGGGLADMAAHARKLGGRLIVSSSPGRGTRITAEIPLAKPTGMENV